MADAAAALVLLFGLLLTALWIYASYWVYKDASRRGSNHAAAWGVGVFLIGFLGLILYLVVRGDVGGGGGGRSTY